MDYEDPESESQSFNASQDEPMTSKIDRNTFISPLRISRCHTSQLFGNHETCTRRLAALAGGSAGSHAGPRVLGPPETFASCPRGRPCTLAWTGYDQALEPSYD